MLDRLYVKLQCELGPGNRAVGKLMENFSDIRGIFSATPAQLKSVLRSNKAEKILNGDFKRTDEILKLCAEGGIKVIGYEDSAFPERLCQIPDPPALIYCKGNLPEIDDNVAIAIVGPRKPDEYGIKAAFSLSARLARGGVVIISGGALGIDTEAHNGALWAKGKTIAVLGCGMMFPYLQANAPLREEIAECGAIISEFPPDYGAYKANFPMRNRIMSGLGLGTVVVQAGSRSGSLITARHAAEQGRDVFVIPGPIGEKLYAGSNQLLKDGAKPVLNVMDILEEYVETYPHRLLLDRMFSKEEPSISKGFQQYHNAYNPKKKAEDIETAPKAVEITELSCSKEAAAIYEAIKNGADSPDIIAEYSGLETTGVIVGLTELEIGGYITAAPGGRYKISE